jgi:hypothetical protein
MPVKQPFVDDAEDNDKSVGQQEANPLEREISFMKQRSTVLRPRGSDSVTGGATRPAEESAQAVENTQPAPTFRQRLMEQYRQRQQGVGEAIETSEE